MELTGTILELLRVAEELRLGREGCRLDPSGKPSPYSKALSLIKIRWTSGPVLVSVSSDHEVLEIQGGVAEMKMLAATVGEFATEGDYTSHLHVEYLPDHEFLSHNSEPLVVTLVE
ncbi:hypothetical protein [Salinispora sp. H7-4]|uniref:Imm32 family immunity protein n=1 Tax=Salinispora sp. H7-4 TaxID=2748321 RepID=UPI0015D2F950|nr:hypothetical protein [Salinispora sp. H7-4]NYT95577.1 hypothetical protein [Salinispora sp. H7-4]